MKFGTEIRKVCENYLVLQAVSSFRFIWWHELPVNQVSFFHFLLWRLYVQNSWVITFDSHESATREESFLKKHHVRFGCGLTAKTTFVEVKERRLNHCFFFFFNFNYQINIKGMYVGIDVEFKILPWKQQCRRNPFALLKMEFKIQLYSTNPLSTVVLSSTKVLQNWR